MRLFYCHASNHLNFNLPPYPTPRARVTAPSLSSSLALMENKTITPATDKYSIIFVFAPSFFQHHHHQPLVSYYTQRVFACVFASTTIVFHTHTPFCNPTTLLLSLYLPCFHHVTRSNVFLYAVISNLEN